MIVDLFAGPGGWSEGLRMFSPAMHTTEIGFEWDQAACETRTAAGHQTVRTDIAQFPLDQFGDKVTGLIASPPCQDFSLAGKHAGIDGDRGQLINQVVRWVEALHPQWVACEQVPPALPVWRDFATHFRTLGYSVWCGVLNAANYGVPQTRKRAFLIASRTHQIQPPEPTHSRNPEPSLFGELQPWVTMADALGWQVGRVGFPRKDDLGTSADGFRERDWRLTDEPVATLTEKARSWVLNPGVTDTQPNRRMYQLDETAPTIAFGHDSANWCWALQRPSTTIMGTDRVAHPRHRGKGESQFPAGRTFTTQQCAEGDVDNNGPVTIRLTPQDALVLQSFPPDYPVSGSKTKQFEQIGNAVPPRLATHVLAAATGTTYTGETQ
jgi:DNA (cytosine-5)-methyltransferase 1